jgi:hypothetical protein
MSMIARQMPDPKTAALHGTGARQTSLDTSRRYSSFVPVVGGKLVVQLPGETMRVPIEEVIDGDTVIVKLSQPPISRTHVFQFEKVYGARRRKKVTGEVWEVQYEQDFLKEQDEINARIRAAREARKTASAPKVVAAAPVAKAAPKPAAKPKAKKKAPKRKAARKQKAA